MRFRWITRGLAIVLMSVMFLQASIVPAHAQFLEWSRNNANPETDCVKSVNVIRGEGAATNVDVATIQGLGCLARNFLAVATTFIGLAAFVMLVVGAFLYLTSGGQTKHIDTAKQTITYAIIGIVVALLAFFILNLLATFTGAKGILRFDIFIENTQSPPTP